MSSLKWLLTVLLVYFGLRLLFFAVTISHHVPPDEVTHYELIKIFSEVSFLPENSDKTHPYGLVTNIPYLYYWIMGRLLNLNFFGVSDLLFLRLFNIPLAFGTVLFAWRILRLLTDDRLTQILLIVAMTNTIMFSFLSASVSYDNLTNLLSVMAVYYLLVFFKTRSGDLLVASLLCQLAGVLTKSSFLPLALVLNVLLLAHEFRNFRLLPGLLSEYFHAPDRQRLVLALGVLLGLALSIQLYGGNYVRYGSLTPGMAEVLSPDKAMQNRLEARNRIFTLFREGRVSMEEALIMTSQIRHQGDRGDAIIRILNYAALKNNEFRLIGPIEYVAFWVQQVLAGVFGIFAHIQIANRGLTILPFAALIALTIIALLLRWRPGDATWIPSCLIAIAVFYLLFLMYVINYRDYLYYASPDVTVQGRYIFPVLGPIYVLSSFYLMLLFRGRYLRLGISAVVCILFIASDFPYFLLNAGPQWFDPLLP